MRQITCAPRFVSVVSGVAYKLPPEVQVSYAVFAVEVGIAVLAAADIWLLADVREAAMPAPGGCTPAVDATAGDVTRGSAAGVNRPLYNFGAKPAGDLSLSLIVDDRKADYGHTTPQSSPYPNSVNTLCIARFD